MLRELAAVRAPLYAQVADLRFDTDHLTPSRPPRNWPQLLDARWQRPGVAA